MSRSISVFGLGYVGMVTAASFARLGYEVIGVDLSQNKVDAVRSGKSPILEPGIENIITSCRDTLCATTDAGDAVARSSVSFISVGTPSERNGKLDLRAILHVCEQIGEALKDKADFHWVVLRSTVLPGTTEWILSPTIERFSGKKAGVDFGVSFVPEFLREGTALQDFVDPPFTVFGVSHRTHLDSLKELFHWAPGPQYETPLATAEMVKYMCNAFHALKVAFANEMGTLGKQLGVDIALATEIFTSDNKLNLSPAYLKAGFGFGGSCLPKDLRALRYRAKELDLQLPLIDSVLNSNSEHIERAVQLIMQARKRKIGVLGLSFKAGTDDLRESPMVHLVKRLLGEGYEVRIWDDNVLLGRLIGSNRRFIEEFIPHIGSLISRNLEEVVGGAEVVVLGSRAADSGQLAPLLARGQILIDLVNLEKNARYETFEKYVGICW